ncbi:MAG: hypothetical protein QG641_2278 [Candidatus Poribacteria bacterium]|nr:hypothetical protein [Candidatus Poribacteria bacterium]
MRCILCIFSICFTILYPSLEIAQAIPNKRPTIAVTTLEHLSAYPENAWVAMSFSESLTVKLKSLNERFNVVERIKIYEVIRAKGFDPEKLQELEIQKQKELGSLIGANYLILGSVSLDGLSEQPNTQILANVRITDIQTGEIKESESVKGSMEELFKLEAQLAFALLKQIGINLTKQETENVNLEDKSSIIATKYYSLSQMAFYDNPYNFYGVGIFKSKDMGFAIEFAKNQAIDEIARQMQTRIKIIEEQTGSILSRHESSAVIIGARIVKTDIYQEGDSYRAYVIVEVPIVPEDTFPRESDWLVIGPFDNTDNKGLTFTYPPESEINLLKTYEGKTGKVVWQKVKDGFVNGRLDFTCMFTPNEWVLVYALIDVISYDDKKVLLRIGSDDGVKVWLNGQVIWTNQKSRSLQLDQDILPIELKKGYNRFLFKVSQEVGYWGLAIRITDEKGQPFDDLKYFIPK